ncbi:aerobic respiration two-component sensor histidine kinase ArcB [Aliivibrio fischeri]|uniref:aerobic respiration two-component sensor histidine kinase ArcB n=1 Tax=Aliivibrio fischeri TaxID=668 RepID=UPI0007C44660|nr:aerobic respiration two-component sensor histidine kinase ArcB [Aliivibrio fischeri]MBP3142744.1 aerobic respiration two-component sensor histidine kinase ArcB [Aliivibrio fischeri]MBP3156634.1 aerobic respiration two-component sensor histidine kinase ArcB [Aliivibrio fischeri]MCE7535424.1 aerobic respiration two-component sensor histidine kinase ArcB [Aliivibrio fischeri]MCE7558319.1 aerobic respiration two-component sensor histidine kinase ArcB [Aliivibrio fischeri]MCE7573367.1 aerobic re
MKQLKILAQFYVDLMVRLGIVRFSLLLAIALVALAVIVQVGVTLVLSGEVNDLDIIRSVFFGLLITPWAVFFLSVVVEHLEDSRQRLSKLVSKLEEMRTRDLDLNKKLKGNVKKLNQEIEEREKAEEARQEAMEDLENEVFQREKAQLELAEQTALLRSYLDTSPDIIYYRNDLGLFSGCNKAMEQLTGKLEKELIGLSPKDVYDAEVAAKVIDTDRQVLQENQALTYEQWLDYPDGRKACFELSKIPFYSKDGRRLGLVGFGRNITERKEYEDALQKASRDKTTFISTISHELRTPLNGIVGLSRMLLDSRLDDEQHNYMRTINVSAITLGNIFNDIIDMDKFDRRKLELFPKPLDFISFVTEMENISGLMAEQKGLRFDLERLTDLPPHISVDSTRLRQVLWNLVGNATKFTKEGGVVMSVSADIHQDSAEITFEIEDTGIGIPEEELENVFAMYYQVKQGKDNLHAVGTGIGLAVSKELINLMGGDITVTSEVDFGSTFIVTINVPLVDHVEEEEAMPETKSSKSLRIFMLEDIELNVTVACSLLESLGHTVDVAMCGEDAIKQFDPTKYDLALLDIQLPDMTGFDVAKTLRDKFDNLPPLIALTANLLKEKDEYFKNGMDEALSKPLSVKALTEVLEQFSMSEKKTDIPSVPQEQEVSSEPTENDQLIECLLDLEMLESYIEIVGTKPIYANIEMFEKSMKEYIQILDTNMTARDQDGIVFETHKMKGAAGSIGLKHIQQVAQKAQSPDLPAWWENIDDWVEEIKNEYEHDIQILKSWLEQQDK